MNRYLYVALLMTPEPLLERLKRKLALANPIRLFRGSAKGMLLSSMASDRPFFRHTLLLATSVDNAYLQGGRLVPLWSDERPGSYLLNDYVIELEGSSPPPVTG